MHKFVYVWLCGRRVRVECWFLVFLARPLLWSLFICCSDKRPNDTLWFSYNYPRWFGRICVLFYRTLLTKNSRHLCGPFSTGSALCLQRSRIVARLTRTSIRFQFVYQLIKRRKATSQAIGVDSGHKPSANTTESSMYFPHTLSFRAYRSVVRSIDSLQARAIAD